MKRDSECTRHMIVASTRRSETDRGVRHKALVWSAGDDHQCLDGGSHACALQAVVAMFPLSEDVDQPLLFQPREVDAGCRRTDVRNDRQLGARPCVTIHQAAENARACRLGDGRGDSGKRRIFMFDIHTLIVNEAYLFANINTAFR
jgi:hypothetical protein